MHKLNDLTRLCIAEAAVLAGHTGEGCLRWSILNQRGAHRARAGSRIHRGQITEAGLPVQKQASETAATYKQHGLPSEQSSTMRQPPAHLSPQYQ